MISSRWLALWTGIVPIVAIHLTFAVSVAEGYVPLCNPYIDSCTSISATGRHGTAFWLFKATMLPVAALLILFWREAAAVLRSIGDHSRAPTVLIVLGAVGAVFLVVYTVALGGAGEYLQLQRRIGIILYFSLTAFAELLMTARIIKSNVPDKTVRWHFSLCAAFLGIGLFTLILDALIPNYDDYEDAFEWVLALIMQMWFVVMFFTFSQKGFRSG